MMVETILESSQDFGSSAAMSNGLPQWKRELLQRRAARCRPPAPPPAPPPPPPPLPPDAEADDGEELRYGPGIVKRLKSRYLSLALRDAPRRRPSVLRRATSLEHLLDERPPPAPRSHNARAPRPASLAAPPLHPRPDTHPHPRRDLVKRARSVDALSRLDSRDEPRAPPSPPAHPPPPPPPSAPRPALPRSARPPRRPQPLLREAERQPPDVFQLTLRKFEMAPTRRAAPAARVPAVLRGLDAPRCSTPEPRARDPSPAAADLSAIVDGDTSSAPHLSDVTPETVDRDVKPVSQAALESIANAGTTTIYSFETAIQGSHLPPVSASNQVLLGRLRLAAAPRRIGVIRPMPAPQRDRSVTTSLWSSDVGEKIVDTRAATPPLPDNEPPVEETPIRMDKNEQQPPAALVEPTPRSPCADERPIMELRDQIVIPPAEVRLEAVAKCEFTTKTIPCKTETETLAKSEMTSKLDAVMKPEPTSRSDVITKSETILNTNTITKSETICKSHMITKSEVTMKSEVLMKSEIVKKCEVIKKSLVNGHAEPMARPVSRFVSAESGAGGKGGESPRGVRRVRPPPPAATSIVFNFSNRKEVPDYIENDGQILRASRRNMIKAGESGVVLLRPDALRDPDSESDGEPDGADGPPSPTPCAVRFVNDNVLINGRSSMPLRPNKDRIAKLKIQFDDSLTRTFEYPSETSLVEVEETTSPSSSPASALAPAPSDAPAQLTANTHLTSESLARYRPSKTVPSQFQLGVTRVEYATHNDAESNGVDTTDCGEDDAGGAGGGGEGAGGACGSEARSWSEARAQHTDLLF